MIRDPPYLKLFPSPTFFRFAFKRKQGVILNYDSWVSKTFIFKTKLLMGEKLDLLLVGDIRELEGSYLSVQDYFHLALIIDLYD